MEYTYKVKKYFKLLLLLLALLIGGISLYFSNTLVQRLSVEEEKKIALWALATEKLTSAESEDLEFYSSIIEANTTIPVILVNVDGRMEHRNLDSSRSLKESYVKKRLELMKKVHEPISIEIGRNEFIYVYYDDSITLKQLRRYPYYQLAVVSLFLLVSYFAFNYSRKAEQNQVWVGLARETAHQLGTPMSSLMAWVDLIDADRSLATSDAMKEMRKDIDRLKVITERFSKIGSEPALHPCDLSFVLHHAIDYMMERSPEQVEIKFFIPDKKLMTNLNIPLFEWVIENLTKNAIDAMDGIGKIEFTLRERKQTLLIDITDNGKGIHSNLFKTIFKPGFTTKKRGWGLGLSLVRRIITEYHHGQIFVKESIPGKKTTFRLVFHKLKPDDDELA